MTTVEKVLALLRALEMIEKEPDIGWELKDKLKKWIYQQLEFYIDQ